MVRTTTSKKCPVNQWFATASRSVALVPSSIAVLHDGRHSSRLSKHNFQRDSFQPRCGTVAERRRPSRARIDKGDAPKIT